MKLKKFQKKKGYSHQQLANLFGKSASTVFRWTNGERMPGKSNMDLIKKKTKGKVKPADFYG
jgi:transcriptional regulator with XRE-family HTH domain